MNTPIKLLIVAAVSVLFGSGCLAQTYDPAVDGDWDQYEASLNEDFTNAELGSPDKPDPTPWVENADPSESDPTPWDIMNGEPGKPDPTPWRADGQTAAPGDDAQWYGLYGTPDKPDPTPWRTLSGEPGKPDPTPWAPDTEETEDSNPWIKTSDSGRPDPTPWRISAR